jgi:hypothetical protein
MPDIYEVLKQLTNDKANRNHHGYAARLWNIPN